MAEYTYKDVIIDPDDPRVEIGKEYYFGCLPRDVLKKANTNSSLIGELKEIRKEDDFPFVFMGFTDGFSCVIRKKEPEKRYVPFDLSKEEDRDALRGKWVKLDQDGFFYEFQITEFIRICDEASTYMVRLPNGSQKTGEELLLFFVFLDGSRVGKPANKEEG